RTIITIRKITAILNVCKTPTTCWKTLPKNWKNTVLKAKYNTMDLKKIKAPVNTITYNRNKIDEATGNIYESISIVSRRGEQINSEIKKELIEKLEEFATFNDSLEEIFENKEQIEVSKFYEKLPKPHALAVQEWLENKIYYRNTADQVVED